MDDYKPPFEELGPTHSSRHTEGPARKNVPPSIKRLVLELGLRYRPASPAQLEGHQAKLVALMMDLADIPPPALERAIKRWVVDSPFLPKASDLVALCRPETAGTDWIAVGNRLLEKEGKGWAEWKRDSSGHYWIEPREGCAPEHIRRDVMDRRGEPMSPADTAELNRKLESLGATARYREDGSRYLVEAA